MPRYKLTIEYFGAAFSGWQRQKNAITAQEVLEDALTKLAGHTVSVVGSSRTDAGVHALHQVAHADMELPIPAGKIPFALNTILPDTIKVLECEEVGEDFHARYSTKRKAYVYKMYVSAHVHPTRAMTHLRVIPPVDVEKMKKALPALIGKHDFKCFLATGSNVKSTVREIYRAELTECGDELTFYVEGNGFLYNMVRIIIGTLLYIGKGKIQPDDMEKIIKDCDREKAGVTAPPHGLYLQKVWY